MFYGVVKNGSYGLPLHAGPGEVLLSDATRSEIDGGLPDVAFEEIGPVVMKGIPAPVRLYRAVRSA